MVSKYLFYIDQTQKNGSKISLYPLVISTRHIFFSPMQQPETTGK